MQLGLVMNLTDASITPSQAAVLAEEYEFESLWVGEHTHLPVATVHRYTSGKYASGSRQEGHVPDVYKRFTDPYVTLAFAAAATSRLRVGTVVALPAEHNPIVLAKEIATLDFFASGRFEWGIGYGWNPLEAANNGIDFKQRRAILREKVLAMIELWTQEVASYDGGHVQLTPSWSWPKPAQRPHPPVLVGAKLTSSTIDHIIEFADGCIPVRAMEGAELEQDLATLRHRSEEKGRDPGTIHVSIVEAEGVAGGKKSVEEYNRRLPKAEQIANYVDLGVDRLLLGIPVGDIDLYRGALDAIRSACDAWSLPAAR